MLKTITPSPQQWDAFVAAHPRAHVLQQSAWGDLKAAYGWQVARLALVPETPDSPTVESPLPLAMRERGSGGEGILAGAQILFRPLPFHLGTMAYLGMGPYLTEDTVGMRYIASNLWRAIDTCARQHGAAFLKWEPGIFREDEPQPDYPALGFRPSPQTVQPPRTMLIDIRDDDEAILARMNQGTRRKIRQSQKNDIRYYEGTRADLATFNGMMQTTGSRNAFGVHSPAYYERAHELFVPHDAALILAEHEGDPLAGIMVFAKGRTAWYLYGASSNIKRNLMGAYGVQWKAIQWAKARGCTTYDMWGIPDEAEATLEAQFETRSDGLWGVYGFKRGWGGQIIRSAGAWDKVYNPIIYAAYRMALRFRGSE
jgi:lipid II:glycine glycyltransferase (peptidoglycan interpeptide bridge formation enzyme)